MQGRWLIGNTIVFKNYGPYYLLCPVGSERYSFAVPVSAVALNENARCWKYVILKSRTKLFPFHLCGRRDIGTLVCCSMYLVKVLPTFQLILFCPGYSNLKEDFLHFFLPCELFLLHKLCLKTLRIGLSL